MISINTVHFIKIKLLNSISFGRAGILASYRHIESSNENHELSFLQISHETEEPSEDSSESDLHEPFPTLQYALEHVSTHVGFNVEVKWTMQLKVC
jgi:hypothetical protein